MEAYTVEILVKGKPKVLIDLNTGQGAEAACRRARMAYIAHDRSADFDTVEARIFEGVE